MLALYKMLFMNQTKMKMTTKAILTAATTLALSLGLQAQTKTSAMPPVIAMTTDTIPTFQLIELPYAPDALEPVISGRTIRLHHGKHLAGYVNNLNRLKKGTKFERETDLYTIVCGSEGALFNNAGQTLNHNLYFTQFRPSGIAPSGEILKRIERQWGSFERFKEAFEMEGAGLFGSGWLWLAEAPNGELRIVRTAGASNPIVDGLSPLLGIDLWEHAYYLDYENRRPEHVKALWNIIDWSIVGGRLQH